MAKKPAAAQERPKTFEAALAELEEILEQIESGNIGLEESLAKYERGSYLIQHCRTVLDDAEKHIESITNPPEAATTEAAGSDNPPV